MRRTIALMLAAALAGGTAAAAAPDPVDRLRAAAADPAALRSAVPETEKTLERGCCYGREADIARAVAPVWQACPEDPALNAALQALLGRIGQAVAIEDPPLARRLFVEAPLACLRRRPGDWDIWFPFVRLHLPQPPFVEAAGEALPGLLAAAGPDPGRIGSVLDLLSGVPAPALPEGLVDSLIERAGNGIWKLPELLARLPGRTGTQALLRLAEREALSIPPEVARWVDASRLRADALRRLGERRLGPGDLKRVAALLAAGDAEVARAAAETLAKADGALPPLALPPPALDRLAVLLRQDDRGCRAAARLLAAAGRPGAVRLLAHWRAVRAGRARDCGWDLEQALKAAAPHLQAELVRLYRDTSDARLLPLLVAAGAIRPVAGLLRTAPDVRLRREAARHLADRLEAHPEDAAARQALRRAALGDADALVRAVAWRALLLTRDRTVTWSRLTQMLRRPGPERTAALELLGRLHLPVPDEVLATLLDAAAGRGDARERIRALAAARRTAQWALDLLSRTYPPREREKVHATAREVLERIHRLEPRVRALLDDADPGVRREAAEWFAVVPAREPATAEALLARLEDPNADVRDSAAMALAKVRVAPPGLLARLEARIARAEPDENVRRKLRATRLHLLCADPQAADRLLAIVLRRAGDQRSRRELLRCGGLAPPLARALLARLDTEPVAAWLPEGDASPEAAIRNEEDPPPWALLTALVPAGLREAWLIRQAGRPGPSWDRRLRLLALAGEIPASMRGAVVRLWVEAVRADAVEPDAALDVFFPKLGYAGLQALADAFRDRPRLLGRAADLVDAAHDLAGRRAAAGGGGGGVPEPGAEHLPWILRHLQAIEKARDTRRLEAFVRLARVAALGRRWRLQRAAYEAGITPLLLGHLDEPGWCRAVRHVAGALLGRMTPPECG